jgi:hypothetical protein
MTMKRRPSDIEEVIEERAEKLNLSTAALREAVRVELQNHAAREIASQILQKQFAPPPRRLLRNHTPDSER